MPDQQMIIPKIDPKVFVKERTTVVENKAQEIQQETTTLPIIIDCKGYPDIPQGIELWYQNIPYPRKGFPDADILNALNIVKKDTISWLMGFGNKYLIPCYLVFGLMPYSWKLKVIDSFLLGYIRKANYWLDFWYYKPEYFCPFAAEVKSVMNTFLCEMGIHEGYAGNLALIFCMFMEHDDRFRLVPQDLFTAITQEELLNHPRKAFKKMGKLLIEREDHAFTQDRFQSVLNILSYALWVPRIRRAFKKAITNSNFYRLQFDEGDIYWAMTWGNYNALGMNLEQRKEKRLKYHEGLEATPYVKMKV